MTRTIDGKVSQSEQNHVRNTPALNSKRIIIVLGSLELGGSERQALLLAQHLVRVQGAHVQVWSLSGTGRATKLCEEYGIPWRVVPLWSRNRVQLLLSLLKFTWILRRIRPDVILPYTTFPNVICGLVWRWTGAQLCVWNQRDAGVERMSEKLEHWAVSQIPWFVSNSRHGAEFMIHTLGVRADRVRVIHNGVALMTTNVADRMKWRSQLGVNEECFLACMVANLSARKDHATLIRAWRKVVCELESLGLRAVLLLAGRFDDAYESLKTLICQLQLGRNIRLLGSVDDIPSLLSAIDLGVFSSRLEGCPNGVLECMAAGLAIVGTDIPGIREAVGPAGYPFLAPLGDAETLAERIITLALHPELRSQLGAINRCRIAMVFDPKRMCDEMVALLSRGLSE
jgi:glycosyltransferase involved in cell wall biosynthesis